MNDIKSLSMLHDPTGAHNFDECIFVNPARMTFMPIWFDNPIWFKLQSNRKDWCWTPYADNKRWMPVTMDKVNTGLYKNSKPTKVNRRIISYLNATSQAIPSDVDLSQPARDDGLVLALSHLCLSKE